MCPREQQPAACDGSTATPDAPLREPLSKLGWQGGTGDDEPQIAALRAELAADAGMEGIGECTVHPDAAGYGDRAAEIFRREGFVVVKGTQLAIADAVKSATRVPLILGAGGVRQKHFVIITKL